MLTRTPAQAMPMERLADAALSAGGIYARFAVPIGVVALSLYVMLTALAAVVFPDPNWDMLPYLAVAGESAHQSPQELHAFAYGAVKAGVSAGDYLVLTDDAGGYRTRMANDTRRSNPIAEG